MELSSLKIGQTILVAASGSKCPFCGDAAPLRSGSNVDEFFSPQSVSMSWACGNDACKSEWTVEYHSVGITDKAKGKPDKRGDVDYPWSTGEGFS